MVRQLRFATLFIISLVTLVASNAFSIEDLQLAEDLIGQNDCENAIPILTAAYRSKLGPDRKKILLNLSFCAEQTQNYKLKEASELALLKIDPSDVVTQLKYLDSLFYLSKYQNVLNYSKKNKALRSYFDFWILRARALYELNKCDQAIRELNNFLRAPKMTRKSEVYYWLGQCHSSNEDYDKALESYRLARLQPDSPAWLKKSVDDLVPKLKEKNRRFFAKIRMQYGYDNNILRENSRLQDSTQLVDLYLNYFLVKKRKTVITLGLDSSFQDYSQNHQYQTASFSPRLSHNMNLADNFKFEYSVSAGKIITNGKADQNYIFISTLAYYQLTQSVELQPSLNYFQNLNNDPIKQFSTSVLLNFYLDRDFFWIGPFFKRSDSAAPVIDSTSFTIPVVSEYSAITRYSQFGLLIGYIKSLSDNFSLQTQYSLNQTEYASINTSVYNQSQVAGTTGRLDSMQTLKSTLTYRYSNDLRFQLGASAIKNTSRGFQGFFTTTAPTNNYEQHQGTIGATFKWP